MVTGALARHYHVAPVSRHVQQHGLGKIAVRVEHRRSWPAVRSCAIRLSSNRRVASAGLTDDVQVSAPRVGIKHHERYWIGI
jgi:hypothetical protein